MKKNFSKITLGKASLIILFTAFFSSCQKNVDIKDKDSNPLKDKDSNVFFSRARLNAIDESIKDGFVVTDGIIHFKDLDSFLAQKEKLNNTLIETRLEATKNKGFTSLLSIYNDYFKSFESAKDEEEKSYISNKYKDFISMESGELKYLNSDLVQSALLNKDGLVYIGKVLYQFTDAAQKIVVDGDTNKLKSNNSSDFVKSFPTILSETTISKGGRRSVTCRGMWGTHTNLNQDRRISLSVFARSSTYPNPQTSGYTVSIQPYAMGTPYKGKYNSNGGYWTYDTYRTENNLSSQWVFSVYGYGQTKTTTASYAYTNDWDGIDYTGTSVVFNNVPYGYQDILNFDINFNFESNPAGKGHYYSRGVGVEQKIVMQCN